MKVTTDSCLFGAWISKQINSEGLIINNCLDIGTGTGLLSLMFVQQNENIIIDAIEIDEAAAAQAKQNIDAAQWKERIKIICADIREYKFEKKYDIIFSNPPFYENELKSTQQEKNIAHHSDELNLKDVLVVIENNLTTAIQTL